MLGSDNVNSLYNFAIHLESFPQEIEDLIKALKDMLFVSEISLTHSSYVVNKVMISSQKLNEIISSTESFGDKRIIWFEEGMSTSTPVVPKFVKLTTQDPKMKSIATFPKGKLVATSQDPSSSKVSTSLTTSSFHHMNCDLLPLPIDFSPLRHHYGECGDLRPNYEKLTSHPCIRVNIGVFRLLLLHVLVLKVRYLVFFIPLHMCAISIALHTTLLGNVLNMIGVYLKVLLSLLLYSLMV